VVALLYKMENRQNPYWNRQSGPEGGGVKLRERGQAAGLRETIGGLTAARDELLGKPTPMEQVYSRIPSGMHGPT
jgi:hypothetical protein